MPEILSNQSNNLPKLLPLIKPSPFSLTDILAYACILMLCCFTYVAYMSSNWFGFSIDIALLTFQIFITVVRWRSYRKLRNTYEVLKAIEEIVKTPKMKEIGNSIIFTILMPTQELISKLKRIHHGEHQ